MQRSLFQNRKIVCVLFGTGGFCQESTIHWALQTWGNTSEGHIDFPICSERSKNIRLFNSERLEFLNWSSMTEPTTLLFSLRRSFILRIT